MTRLEDLFVPGNATDFFENPPPPFRPDATSYDAANAWWLAELSRLVYRQPDDRQRFLDDAGLEEISEPNKHYFVVRAKDRSWGAVVFRGSNDLRDWYDNLDCSFGYAQPLGPVDRCSFRKRGLDAIPPRWV